MSFLIKNRSLIKSLNPRRTIATFPHLSQEPQLAEHQEPSPLPPNPSFGGPIYQENLRKPIPSSDLAQPLVPLGYLHHTHASEFADVTSLMDAFAKRMASQKWSEIKQLFEFWIRCLDKNGRPNKPDVNVFNHYLRANLMSGASAGELLDLVAQMDDYHIEPNTASFNLVLKAMYNGGEYVAAQKLLERMLQTGNDSLPNEDSYGLVIRMLFLENKIDDALKFIDMTLKSGYMLSMAMFTECVRSCVNAGRLDTLASIIERCKAMDQNKALCPGWNLCNYIAEIALQEDSSKLAFFSLEFIARWIARCETLKPPVLLSIDEGLVVSALGTAGRTYNPTLLDASWAILRRSLRQKRAPNVESFLGKIYAHASLGNLQRAFGTLNEFESAYGQSTTEALDLFSPFTSLHPLVLACSKKGYETLDSVYFQLENLSKADPPYKSVAALNCIVLGCANIWDLDRAYQTFEAISSSFGLTPDIHSYNALMCAFGKLKKTFEASRVFDHLVSLGVQPNATSYATLVDAHIINKDAKAALSVMDEMVIAGFKPTKEMLKKVRRRCMREFDYISDDQVEDLARKFNIRMASDNRRNMLFNLQYTSEYP